MKQALLMTSADKKFKQEEYTMQVGANEMQSYIGWSEGAYGYFGSLVPNTFNGIRLRAFATDIGATTLVLDDTKQISDDILKGIGIRFLYTTHYYVDELRRQDNRVILIFFDCNMFKSSDIGKMRTVLITPPYS